MQDQELIPFIRSCVRSVWALELLLLMRRRPEPWGVDDLVRELRGANALVSGILTGFETAGIVSRPTPDRYLYSPTPAMHAYCDALAAAYDERPVRVVNLIVSASAGGQIQSFADAFKFKGDG